MLASLDLDVAEPCNVPDVLRAAAERFHESRSELRAAWQDKAAGAEWGRIARILERAAAAIERKPS